MTVNIPIIKYILLRSISPLPLLPLRLNSIDFIPDTEWGEKIMIVEMEQSISISSLLL